MKVCFETFGCRLNRADALQMEAEYLANGWERTEKHSDADLVVIHGCSVTQRAQHTCEKLISHLKRHYPLMQVRVCGCLDAAKEKSAPRTYPPLRATTPLPTRTARAYLKVQDGCDGKCTYCVVPKFRGAPVSIPFDSVMDKAKRFIDAGYHEIVVTGCNLTLYESEGRRLPDLLTSLADLTPHDSDTRTRIRLGSVEPGECAIDCVHAMAGNANVCRFLHLSVQSGANRILMAMKRPYLSRDINALVLTAQKLVPNIRLGCDLITGFPNETDLDFEATHGLLLRHFFSNAHIFPYSERPGTPAAAYGGAIPPDIRFARAKQLAKAADGNRYSYAKQFYGKTVEIVVEGEEECNGRTDEYLWCNAIGHAPRKSIAKVLVTKVHHDGSLEGTVRKA